MYILEGTVLAQKLEGTVFFYVHETVKMLIIIMSRSNSKLDRVGSNTRSLGQILEKSCVHSKGHNFDSKFMKLYQNANDHNI